jgi:hypothetical protein
MKSLSKNTVVKSIAALAAFGALIGLSACGQTGLGTASNTNAATKKIAERTDHRRVDFDHQQPVFRVDG